MYNIKLISILFLIISLNISCKSSSYLSSEEDGYKNNGDIYYFYGLGRDPNSDLFYDPNYFPMKGNVVNMDPYPRDPNTICKYVCNFTERGLKYETPNCDRYYFLNPNKLDKTTLELVQDPSAFAAHNKTFKLKNLQDLFNYKDLKEDSDDNPRCDFRPYFRYNYGHFHLWTPDFKNKLPFYFKRPSYLTITEEGKNNTWNKCTRSDIYNEDFIELKGYCRKNEKGSYQMLIYDDINTHLPDKYISSSNLKYLSIDFLEKYISPNLEYLGLEKNDCINLDGPECISLNSGFIFDMSVIPSNPSYKLKSLYLLTESFNEDDDLYFLARVSYDLPRIYYRYNNTTQKNEFMNVSLLEIGTKKQ